MTTGRYIFQRARELGVTIKADGRDLLITPKSAITADLLAAIRSAKPELMYVLAGDYTRAALELLLREVPSPKARLELAHDFDARVVSAGLEDGILRGEATRIAYRVIAQRVESLTSTTINRGMTPQRIDQ